MILHHGKWLTRLSAVVTHEQQKGRKVVGVEVELLSFLQRVLPKLSVNTFLPAFVLERAPCGSSHSQIPCVIEVGFMRAALIPFLLNGLWGFSLTLLGRCLEAV